jgi:xylulokinase
VAHDQIANIVGSGILSLGMGADGIGTCECITPIFDKKVNPNDLAKFGYGMIPFLDNKTHYCCYALSNTAGCLFDWFIMNYYGDLEKKEAISKCNNSFIDEISDLFVLPYFAGSGTPYNDPNIKGLIYGLNLESKRETIYHSLLESMCFENLLNIETLNEFGVNLNELYVSGGGSINDNWMQIKADITNLKVHQLETKDAGTIGTIIIVKKALGIIDSYLQGIDEMVKVKKTFYPRKERHELYRIKYEKYKKLYNYIKEFENE